jgi:hypothetical protein
MDLYKAVYTQIDLKEITIERIIEIQEITVREKIQFETPNYMFKLHL